MSEYQWVSLIALCAWLAIAVVGLRSRATSPNKLLTIAIVWCGIFLAVGVAFTWLGAR